MLAFKRPGKPWFLVSSGVQCRVLAAVLANQLANQSGLANGGPRGRRKCRTSWTGSGNAVSGTAVYIDENGRRKSAGTYETQERAQAVAEQHESQCAAPARRDQPG